VLQEGCSCCASSRRSESWRDVQSVSTAELIPDISVQQQHTVRMGLHTASGTRTRLRGPVASLRQADQNNQNNAVPQRCSTYSFRASVLHSLCASPPHDPLLLTQQANQNNQNAARHSSVRKRLPTTPRALTTTMPTTTHVRPPHALLAPQ
jgi:hypothetical protein